MTNDLQLFEAETWQADNCFYTYDKAGNFQSRGHMEVDGFPTEVGQRILVVYVVDAVHSTQTPANDA